MKGIHVDAEAKTVRVEPGVIGKEFDHACTSNGLAVTIGTISHTGVVGLTLGGGFRWLGREMGVGSSNVISVDLVTAEGKLITVTDTNEHKDLMFGIRGAGPNFGVVTSMQFRLHPIAPTIYHGIQIYPLPAAKAIIRKVDEFCKNFLEDQKKAMVVWVLATGPDGHKALIVNGFYNGSTEEGEKVFKGLKEIGTPVMVDWHQIPYAAVQSSLDPIAVHYRHYYSKGALTDLPAELSDNLVHSFETVPSPNSNIVCMLLGGNVANNPNAALQLNSRWFIDMFSGWEGKENDEVNKKWCKDAYDVNAKFWKAKYANFISEDDASNENTRLQAYGDSLGKLQQLKKKYDPNNVFRSNVNIQPK